HYRKFQFAATMLNLLVDEPVAALRGAAAGRRTAVVFVNRYDGLGVHALRRARALLGRSLQRMVFLSVVQVDWDKLRDREELARLRRERAADLGRYERMAHALGAEAEHRLAFGTDVVRELETLSLEVAERHPDAVFVAGQVVFESPSFVTALLHNQVAFALQRRLIFRGLDMVVVPVQLPAEVW